MLKANACGMLLIALLGLNIKDTLAQTYPVKAIRIIAPEPGGSGDERARLLAQGMSVPLHQPVIVDNRPSSLIGELIAKAAPDGYTIASGGGPLWLGPLLQATSYDPIKDFSPITWSSSAPHLLVVHPALPVQSVKELITLAKSRPGELNFSSGPIGSETQLGGDLFKSMANISTVRISYKGTIPAFNSLISGEVQWMIYPVILSMPQVRAGRLRALAITSSQPSSVFPDIPTVASAGLPGYELLTISGLIAPGGTPSAIIDRLNQEIVRVLNRADMKEKYTNDGADVVGSTPTEFATKITSEIAKWQTVIKNADIKNN